MACHPVCFAKTAFRWTVHTGTPCSAPPWEFRFWILLCLYWSESLLDGGLVSLCLSKHTSSVMKNPCSPLEAACAALLFPEMWYFSLKPPFQWRKIYSKFWVSSQNLMLVTKIICWGLIYIYLLSYPPPHGEKSKSKGQKDGLDFPATFLIWNIYLWFSNKCW